MGTAAMTAPIILALSVPPSANRYWRTRVYRSKETGQHMAMTYPSAEAKAFQQEVVLRAAAAGVREPLPGRVQVAYRYFPNRPQDWAARQRKLGPEWDDGVMALDLDNIQKCLLDSLKGVVFGDDKLVHKIVAERCEPDEHGARVVVYVSAIPKQIVQESLL